MSQAEVLKVDIQNKQLMLNEKKYPYFIFDSL